jgi:hypothetical protein
MTQPTNATPNNLADMDPDRILWGARDIGQEINRTTSQTFRMLEEGLLPAKKIKKIWVSTPRQLRQALTAEPPSP